MRPGDVVTIYKDPLTETKREGEAKLVRKISERSFAQGQVEEQWLVRFKGERSTYQRWIKRKEEN